MKVNLKGLPDKLRSGAWPSSARAVRRAVKSVNERDPHPMLLAGMRHSWETASDELEEGVGYGRSVCPEFPRLHAAYNGRDNGLRLRKEKPISKPYLGPD